MSKKIVFLASGNGGTLKFLYYAIKLYSLPFEIISVIADRDCGAYKFAKSKNIEAQIIDYTKASDEKLINLLSNLKTDIIITNIHKILTENVLNSTKADFINLHYSLLPAFSGFIGMKTVDEAKKQNCQIIGATCHNVTKELDGGRVICQGCFRVNWGDNIEEIYDNTFRCACLTFLNGIIIKYLNFTHEYDHNQYMVSPKLHFDTAKCNEEFWQKLKL